MVTEHLKRIFPHLCIYSPMAAPTRRSLVLSEMHMLIEMSRYEARRGVCCTHNITQTHTHTHTPLK